MTSAKGLAPQRWLVENLRPQKVPVNRSAVVRAAVCIPLPLVVGLAADQPVFGALGALGAMSGVISDSADAYRMRAISITVPNVFGAVGITLGGLVNGHGWVLVATLTGIALVSGMMSTIGAVSSASGMLLLLNAVVGSGLPLPSPWWVAPVLMMAGAGLVLVSTLLGWPVRPGTFERASVASVYYSTADLLALAGTGRSAAYEGERRALTRSLDQSYDLLLSRRARQQGRSPVMTRLLTQLNAITPIVEAAPAAHLSGHPLVPEVSETLRHLAQAIDTGYSGPVPVNLPVPSDDAARAVDRALRYAVAVVTDPDGQLPSHAPDTGYRDMLSDRVLRAAHNVAFSGASWRYGLRLALCIGIAQALVSLTSLSHAYWVGLTITFVLKPDLGSVFSRAVLRAVGTVGGLLIAALALVGEPAGWWYVLVLFLLGPLIPAIARRGYAYQTAAITPVILVISDILSHGGTALLLPRLGDSLLGCGIALVAGYLLWPESWRTRVGDRLADAIVNATGYLEAAFGADTEEAVQACTRRQLYRDLSGIRTEFQRALSEPLPTGRKAAFWWPLVVAVERIIDAVTAARVHVQNGRARPSPEEVSPIVFQLRELAQGVRTAQPLPVPHADLAGPVGSVLEPLRQEVTAARAVASSR
ncbi:integral membrane protein [Streptomyces hygroscopicus subsp. jinggangensis 5008]|nr:integral membrane protein [Streptomyces hygroscopicus subsp. jinggangensis 5008]